MKKTLTAFALVAMCATAAPAFACHKHGHKCPHHHGAATSTTSSTVTTYRTVMPLTAQEVAERRQLQTTIDRNVKLADLNGDRQISFDEYSYGDQRLHQDSMDIRQSFETADADKNGKLNSQEIMDVQWAAIKAARGETYVSTKRVMERTSR